MSLGPVLVDITSTELDTGDRRRLIHPQVGGVILFARNYDNPDQLKRLTEQIHAIRSPGLLIAVDQEGGRVQRFKNEFQRLPAMGRLGETYDLDSDKAISLAQTFGWIMATELLHYGIDLSFAPVLDLYGVSNVIGDRAFHSKAEVVSCLANAWIRGMTSAGMQAVGKHFPGHGSVAGDSHHVMPFDPRSFDRIWSQDLITFRNVINTHLAGLMMAHVIYDQCDHQPAGYSAYWIQQVLRQQLNFEGVVFSDDLSMIGAEFVGGYAQRARTALAAGCDQLLVCNNPDGADEVLNDLSDYNNPASQLRLMRLHGKPNKYEQFGSNKWNQEISQLAAYNQQSELMDSSDLFL